MANSYSYHHTQPATLIVSIMTVTIILTVYILGALGLVGWLVAIVGLEILGLYLFRSLTVVLDSQSLSFWFGPGFWRKGVVVTEIESVSEVRNHWYNGWGIRYFIARGGRRGWLYNVSGFDAVEFKMKSGKYFRIGTDKPSDLARAVRSALQESQPLDLR